MPGRQMFKVCDNMNIADDNEDEKPPFADIVQKYSSNSQPSNSSSSPMKTPDVTMKTPLGSQPIKICDNKNVDDDSDDDEKQPLAAMVQKYSQSSKSSSSPVRTPDVAKKAPRAVVARPPTSHGSKKKTPTSAKSVRKPPPPMVNVDSSSSDDEVVLSTIASPEKMMKLSVTPKKKSTVSPVKTPKTKTRPSTSGSSPRRSNPFSPTSMKQRRFQSFSNRLERLWETKERQKSNKAKREYNNYAHVAITALQRDEIERIANPDVRADVLKRFDIQADRNKVKNMTEEERTQYLKEKSAAHRKQQREKEENERKRYEDTSIESKSLSPSPKPVELPDGFTDCAYGDVLMVINFIRSYAGLLTPKEDVRLLPDDFANALVNSEQGYPYLAKVLLILLHTLIHDEEAAFRKEMGVKLTDLELNSSTVGELVRLCLRKQQDEGDDRDDVSSIKSKGSFESTLWETVDEDIMEEISGNDFLDLSPSTKLKLFTTLSNRLLSSVAVENYLLDVLQQHADAVQERNTAGHEHNRLSKEIQPSGKDSKQPSPVPPPTEEAPDEAEDIASKVKRRRLMADERAKKDAEERAAEEKRKAKELAEYRARSRWETATKKLEDIHAFKKMVLRVECLGTDRNHSRYWYFGKWLPVLFVEQGWSSIDYPIASSQDTAKAREAFVETTFPQREPNEWLVYENAEDVENLVKVLCVRGIRESKLKEHLEICVNEMKTAKEGWKNAANSVVVKDYLPLVEDFKSKLLQLEGSIRNGGLGGVLSDYMEWKTGVESGTTIAELGEKLIQVCNGVRPTLLGGILAPLEAAKRESDSHDAKSSNAMHRWCDEIRQCKTWSRLHVLMSMLRSCIRWDRSVEHAKCRICRKKQDDDLALVCDNCNDIYHMYCLRPPLKKLPVGEWFCMSCKPRPEPRKAKQLKRSAYVEIDEDEDEEAEAEEQEEKQENGNSERNENCIVCGEGEFEDQSDELIVCTECLTSFHLNCHTPPLRHRPRNAWRCHQCTSGRKGRTTRLRDKLERGCKVEASKALNLLNRDLYDDEVTSTDGSESIASEKRRKRSTT